MAAQEAVEVADVKCSLSDFQAKGAVGGRKERFVEGHFNPRNGIWRYRDHEGSVEILSRRLKKWPQPCWPQLAPRYARGIRKAYAMGIRKLYAWPIAVEYINVRYTLPEA
jgi:hypothetical protein